MAVIISIVLNMPFRQSGNGQRASPMRLALPEPTTVLLILGSP
jgi:hypothetical protein